MSPFANKYRSYCTSSMLMALYLTSSTCSSSIMSSRMFVLVQIKSKFRGFAQNILNSGGANNSAQQADVSKGGHIFASTHQKSYQGPLKLPPPTQTRRGLTYAQAPTVSLAELPPCNDGKRPWITDHLGWKTTLD